MQRVPAEKVSIDSHPVEDAAVYVEDHRLIVRLGRRIVTILLGERGTKRLTSILNRRN